MGKLCLACAQPGNVLSFNGRLAQKIVGFSKTNVLLKIKFRILQGSNKQGQSMDCQQQLRLPMKKPNHRQNVRSVCKQNKDKPS